MKRRLTAVHGGRNKSNGRFIRMMAAGFSILLFCILFSDTALAEKEIREAEHTPWSGYWWPMREGGLATGDGYRGHPAPLEKYEMLFDDHPDGKLVEWYKLRYHDPEAPAWFGLCANWAWASVYENYEIYPSSRDNIVIRVGDKKGLLTLAHDEDLVERADGSEPDVFHYWLLNYIKDQRKAFVADLDAGEEIWSYPIYRYEMETLSTPVGTVSVTVTIFYANDFVHPDYMGAEVRHRTYTYDLQTSGGAITGGKWTGYSTANHPQGLSMPLAANTNCPYIDYERVVELARSKDDFLENGAEAVTVNPGAYNLILMDEDVYRIDAKSDDAVRIVVEKQESSFQTLQVSVENGGGEVIVAYDVEEGAPMDFVARDGASPYTVRVRQPDYAEPSIYTLGVDIDRNAVYAIPYIPKNGMWSGFALTNPSDQPVRDVLITTYREDGMPVQTIADPFTMAPGERRSFLFSDMAWRKHELGMVDHLRVLGEDGLHVLNLFADGQEDMASFAGPPLRSSRIIIPDTSAAMDVSKNVASGVLNQGFDDLLLEMRLYSGEGFLMTEVGNEPLTSRSAFPMKSSRYPFYTMPRDGWIEIRDTDGASINGFTKTRADSRMDSIFALTAEFAYGIVPHVPEPGHWETTLTLINPNDIQNDVSLSMRKAGADGGEEMSVTLAAREKRTITMHDQFGKYPGAPNHHAIVEINAAYPIAGYYKYSTPEDSASMPLINAGDLKTELILPHYAGNDGFWWTGVGIFNPSDEKVTIRGIPYDDKGTPMDYAVRDFELASGEYDIFLIRSRFGEDVASMISFVKFRSLEGGTVGGFFLYGNEAGGMLSGGNM